MSLLTSVIGGLVVLSCFIRGVIGFYDDFKPKPKKEETN